MSQRVLLLRAPAAPPQTDPYTSTLRSARYVPLSIPVLETVLIGTDTLGRRITQGPDQVKGVVVTSARAAEAWGQAADGLADGDLDAADWRTVPFYTVGHATAAVLADLAPSHSASHPRLYPHDIRGAETGNASALAHFIVQDQSPVDSTLSPRLLYLTGDKNRDTLPRILHEGGIEVDELQVYATRGASGFAHDLEEILRSQPTDAPDSGAPWWITFFAPSAAAYVLPYLRAHFHLSSTPPDSSPDGMRTALVAAIGPTTADFLRSQLNLRVDAVAKTPNAEGLVQAFNDADGKYHNL